MTDSPKLAAIRARDCYEIDGGYAQADDDRRTLLRLLDEARANASVHAWRAGAAILERDALAAREATWAMRHERETKITDKATARVAALERVVSRHVKWRDKALRYLCMVRDRAPSYRPLIERFIDDSTGSMIGSVDEEISRGVVAASQSETKVAQLPLCDACKDTGVWQPPTAELRVENQPIECPFCYAAKHKKEASHE